VDPGLRLRYVMFIGTPATRCEQPVNQQIHESTSPLVVIQVTLAEVSIRVTLLAVRYATESHRTCSGNGYTSTGEEQIKTARPFVSCAFLKADFRQCCFPPLSMAEARKAQW